MCLLHGLFYVAGRMGTQPFWGEDVETGQDVSQDSSWKQTLMFNGMSPGYPVEVFLSIMEHQMAVKNIQTDQQRLAFALPYIEPWDLEWASRCDLYLIFLLIFFLSKILLLTKFFSLVFWTLQSMREQFADIDLASYAS